MSKEHEPSLGGVLKKLRAVYLDKCDQEGGTASGFRDYIAKWQTTEPMQLEKLAFEALMEAATKAWQAPPKKRGDDLFSINGIVIPEFLTRPATGYVNGEEIETDEEDHFEKVSFKFATVKDAFEDALIKSRKANQAASAAEEKMRMVDEARRRAKGDMSVLLVSVRDIETEA